ncbi:hypothetical protein CERSUDRAFT_101725 [Gelatoporia subvermispora B]|uniref:Uncharacterized protein n=1 Tax=Ceriporiopsis subvermispora (strain B) TaxID=914234 RepID=M2QWA7_CERS8|nr:hypothetical protein CERSUDRAFT_101725 [Gelatoporia subvermispora B]
MRRRPNFAPLSVGRPVKRVRWAQGGGRHAILCSKLLQPFADLAVCAAGARRPSPNP